MVKAVLATRIKKATPTTGEKKLLFFFKQKIGLFVRAKEGAVAVEFGLISIPLFMLIVGILEIAMLFASSVVLEGSTVVTSRLIRTGQVQQSMDPQAAFESSLCAQVDALMDCDSLRYEVIQPAGNNFSSADNLEPQFNADGDLISNGFDAGGVSDVVLIRTSYRYRFITPFLADLFSNSADNGVTLLSTVTLRNEPYDFED